MGLELVCNNTIEHLSFTGIQQIRKRLIEATIEYLRQNVERNIFRWFYHYIDEPLPENEADYSYEDNYDVYHSMENEYYTLIDYLQKLITIKNNYSMSIMGMMINYDMLRENKYIHDETMKAYNVYGIIPFIHHSDIQGFITQGEALDFMKTLHLIYPYIPVIDFNNNQVKLEQYILYDIFQECINTGSNIGFS